MIKLEVLDESLTDRDNGVFHGPHMTISPEQLPQSTRTYPKAPTLTGHGNVTGVTRKGKPSEGWGILRHRKVLEHQKSHQREKSEEERAGDVICQTKQWKSWIISSQHLVTNAVFILKEKSVNGTTIPSEVPSEETAWEQPLLHIPLATKNIYWNQDRVVSYLWSLKGLHLLDNLFIMNNSTSFIWKSLISSGCSLGRQQSCITTHFFREPTIPKSGCSVT